jgi:hypothetical protein
LKNLLKNAPQAAVLYDKLHIFNHLGDTLDTVRKQKYARHSFLQLNWLEDALPLFFTGGRRRQSLPQEDA